MIGSSQFFIGIDPGSYKLGVGVLDMEGNYLMSCVLKPRDSGASAHKRLRDLSDQLAEVFSLYPAGIGAICVEQPFLRTGVEKTALVVAGAYWMAVSAAEEYGIPLIYTPKPNEIKKLAGRGDFDKEQMTDAALRYWRLVPGALKFADEADALWGALYALTSWKYQKVPQLDVKIKRPRQAKLPQMVVDGKLAPMGTKARRKRNPPAKARRMETVVRFPATTIRRNGKA